MSDRTTEIRESLEWMNEFDPNLSETPTHPMAIVVAAARAYADLLDNGPDYEAAHIAQHAIWCGCGDVACHPSAGTEVLMDEIRTIVDAALAAVVDTPKET